MAKRPTMKKRGKSARRTEQRELNVAPRRKSRHASADTDTASREPTSPTPPRRARRRTQPVEDTPPPPSTAGEQVTGGATDPTAARIRHAICPNRPTCYTRAQFDPHDSLEQLRAQGFTLGLDPETQFPICPNCRTTMVDAEPVDAPEAIRQAIAAGGSHQPRLWADPPFNSGDALRMLFEKRREVRQLKDAAEAAQRGAKKAQKAYAKGLVEKDAMEEAFETRMLEKQREAQRRLERAEQQLLDDEARAASRCVYERATGQPCRVCRAESPSLIAAALQASHGALTDPASDAHRVLALTANSRRVDFAEKLRDASLVLDALTARGLLGIPEDVVQTWDDAQRREALAWVDTGLDRAQVPAVLGLPHVAAIAGEGVQCCGECGAQILQLTAADDGDVQPYRPGAFVGLHCTGVEPAVSSSTAATAAAAPA